MFKKIALTSLSSLFIPMALVAHSNSANEVSITEDGTYRYIQSNGIPDHETGEFPNSGNPHSISKQNHSFRIPLNPQIQSQLKWVGLNTFGVALNGVILDPATAEFWENDVQSGWNYNALTNPLGFDESNAHVQPQGAYHYHGYPTALAKKLKQETNSTLIGYAADGFPIHVTDTLLPSYRIKQGTRPNGPGGQYDGTYVEDFEYVTGLGDLDECNGKIADGQYVYYLTQEFPNIPRCWKGEPDPSMVRFNSPSGFPDELHRRRRPPRQQKTNGKMSAATKTTTSGKMLSDVHGAGAQRSDPKSGDPNDYPDGHGPQGDVVRIYNYARCVRDSSSTDTTNKYAIVDTGQDKCYDDGAMGELSSCPSANEPFYGQDAQYARNVPSYTDNGDGTVTDNVTGLMWQKAFKKVEWSNSLLDAKADMTGGYSDWRVPNIKEMYSLIKFNGATGQGGIESSTTPSDTVPYIDTNSLDFEYSPTQRYIDSQYITSSSYVSTTMVVYNKGDEECFFGVNFADGRIKCYPKTGNREDSTFYARYVRANTNYGKNDFQDNGDNTITDNATGLMWMKVDSGDSHVSGNLSRYKKNDGSLDWGEALNFCENLTFATYSDWRLPNPKELHSIVNYGKSPDTTSSPAISSVFSTTSIKGEDGKTDYPFFWTSTTHLDGPTISGFAIYFAFGEAKGFIDESPSPGRSPAQNGAPPQGSPPQEAIDACNGLNRGDSCSFSSPKETVEGTCHTVKNQLACGP